jgi:hypothetical protein
MQTMSDRTRGWLAVTAATAGAAAVVVSELVIWSGQPAGDAFEQDVLNYSSGQAGRIRTGDVVWSIGIAALVLAAVLIRPRLQRGPGRAFLAGLAGCGVILVGSAGVAYLLAGDASGGTIGAPAALDRWELERALFDGARIMMAVPLLAVAVALDRDRRFGVAMTTTGVILAGSLLLPLGPWNFLAGLVWIAASLAFMTHRPRPRVYARVSGPGSRPAIAA